MDDKEKEMLDAITTIKKAEIYRDCVIIASFTILAIAFQKWWISLFSILIMLIARAIAVEVANDDRK